MRQFLFIILLVLVLVISGCAIDDSGVTGDDIDLQGADDSKAGLNEGDERTTAEENEGTDNGELAQDDTKANDSITVNQVKIPLTLYYQDIEGNVIPVTRKVVKQEGIARAAINGMIDSALTREEMQYYGLYPVIPGGAEILGINIKDGTAVIDFNDKILEYKDATSERNIITSIVYTLTEFKSIDNVKILINGYHKEKLKYDTDISGLLSRDNVMINTSEANLEQGRNKYDVYYIRNINEKYSYFIPVSISYTGSGSNIPGRIIDDMADMNIKAFTSMIPEGTRIIESSIKGSTLTLDFNTKLKSYGGGTAREDALLKQILYSMKQIEGIDRVRILISGKTDTLPEGSDISKDISIPDSINAVID